MTAEDFFNQVASDPVRRDGRPELVPRGAPKGAKALYSRPSGYADRVEDMRHIHKWEMRHLARAMSLPVAEDLRELAAAEVYTTAFDVDDERANRASGKRLDDVVRRALDRVQIHRKADRGTAIHGFAESRDRLWEVPETLRPHVEGYWRRIDEDGIEILAVEMFVANDTVMAAGTFDSIVRHPSYGVCIADIKTGKISPGYAVQMAIYANGELYDTDTDERFPLESLSGGEEIRRDIGLLFDVKPDGTRIHTVDLTDGWAITQAIQVVADKLNMNLFAEVLPKTLEQRIVGATTLDELKMLWNTTNAQWGDKHKEAAAHRAAVLEGS